MTRCSGMTRYSCIGFRFLRMNILRYLYQLASSLARRAAWSPFR